eukprot:7858096-Pyramimonas_sp.AAC.1
MAPALDDKEWDVLLGPRNPEWACGACTRLRNWASRIKCECGRSAPAHIRARAVTAHKVVLQQLESGGGKARGKGKGGDKTQKG